MRQTSRHRAPARQPRRATMLMAAAGVVLATAAGLLATRAAPGHPGVQAVTTAVVRPADPGAVAAPAAGCGLPNPGDRSRGVTG